MAIGKCLKCEKVAEMTQDHVIPQWFNRALIPFELQELQDDRIELVCKECNQNKGGKLDFSNERLRIAVKGLVSHLLQKVREHEEFNP